VTISHQPFTPEILAPIPALIDANPGWSRRKLSMQVCEWLEWRSLNGQRKEMSCRVALLELERAGLLHSPGGPGAAQTNAATAGGTVSARASHSMFFVRVG
jgi:hypothetical protein